MFILHRVISYGCVSKFYVHENKWSKETFNSQTKIKQHYLIFRPHENKTYLAVGSMKTLMLNVSLFNAGDDAYETTLHVKLPFGLYFIKILDLVSIKNSNTMRPYDAFFNFFKNVNGREFPLWLSS